MSINKLKIDATKLMQQLNFFINDYQKLEDNTNQTALSEVDLYAFNALYKIADGSSDIARLIEQMNKPVKLKGYLEKNINDRYELNGYELSSGSPVEVWVDDDYYDCGGFYYPTRIEHTKGDYYAVGISGSLEGKKARVK